MSPWAFLFQFLRHFLILIGMDTVINYFSFSHPAGFKARSKLTCIISKFLIYDFLSRLMFLDGRVFCALSMWMCMCGMVKDKECVSIRILPAVSFSVFPRSFSHTSALPVIHPVCGKRQQSKDQKDVDDGALGPIGAWKTLISAPECAHWRCVYNETPHTGRLLSLSTSTNALESWTCSCNNKPLTITLRSSSRVQLCTIDTLRVWTAFSLTNKPFQLLCTVNILWNICIYSHGICLFPKEIKRL